MSIDYTILGVLIEAPTHGYSLKKYLAENVSRDFGINDGQLYPALARLEERGWIRKRVIPQRRSPTKHQYSATPKGERAFLAWLSDPEADASSRVGPPRPRYDFYWKHEFLQRLTFFRYLDPERARAQVEKHIEEASGRIADLEGVCAEMDARDADPYRRMIADYGVRYQCMRRDWLRALLATTERAARHARAEDRSQPETPAASPDGSEGREHVRVG